MKSIVTDDCVACFICGREAEAEHHLVFGTAGRELSEKDGLKVPVCNNCHNMGEITRRIHGNSMAERMSKIIGQLAWERQWILKDAVHYKECDEEVQAIESRIARKEFRKRYGISYL